MAEMAGIQDGYGDGLTIEEIIAGNERLLKIKAAERMRGNSNASDVWDDVLQEGRIVQAQVLQKRPDAPRAYVSAAMSHRISEVLSRGTWTGMSRTHGKPVDPLRRPQAERDSFDDPNVDDVVSSGDWVDQVLQGYHHGQILQALNQLTFTQRAYVYERFWEGRTNAEIASRSGVSKGEVERQWRCNIRPHLVAQLGLLADL